MTTIKENGHLLRVGDLARLTGKSVRAIRLYEEMGLMQPVTRSSGGFRLYGPEAVEHVRWIDLLHEMGFSLQEMKELRRSWWSAEIGPEAMATLRGLFERKLDETRASMRRFQQLENELLHGLAYLETCRVCETPGAAVSGCVRCGQDHGMKHEPALVAGIVTSPAARRTSARPLVRVEDIG